MLDWQKTLESQYANSNVLLQLIENFNEAIDPTNSIDAFYNLVWDVDTAQGHGLDIWGRIVGVGRVLQVAAGDFFGFTDDNGSTASGEPYGQAPFYSGQATTSNYALSDSAFRTLIYAKALSNISDGSIPSINQILLKLFPGRGNCYVTDGMDDTMTFTFDFTLTPVEQAIVSQTGILPRPVGVSVTIVQV